jgi:hypothetical protein
MARTDAPWRGRLARWALAAALGLSVLGLAGCSAGRENLGTSDAPCYIALPTAAEAVGSHGRLIGVRLESVPTVTYRRLDAALDRAGVRSGRVCLVAYGGTFSSNSVARPQGRPSGHLAVVVLRYPSGTLVATVLFHRLPTRFGHSHLG